MLYNSGICIPWHLPFETQCDKSLRQQMTCNKSFRVCGMQNSISENCWQRKILKCNVAFSWTFIRWFLVFLLIECNIVHILGTDEIYCRFHPISQIMSAAIPWFLTIQSVTVVIQRENSRHITPPNVIVTKKLQYNGHIHMIKIGHISQLFFDIGLISISIVLL